MVKICPNPHNSPIFPLPLTSPLAGTSSGTPSTASGPSGASAAALGPLYYVKPSNSGEKQAKTAELTHIHTVDPFPTLPHFVSGAFGRYWGLDIHGSIAASLRDGKNCPGYIKFDLEARNLIHSPPFTPPLPSTSVLPFVSFAFWVSFMVSEFWYRFDEWLTDVLTFLDVGKLGIGLVRCPARILQACRSHTMTATATQTSISMSKPPSPTSGAFMEELSKCMHLRFNRFYY